MSRVCLLAAAILLVASFAQAIVVSDSPNASWHLTTSPGAYDGVGYLTSVTGTSAVVINPWFIITANHALGSNYLNHQFKMDLAEGRVSFNMIQKYQNPTADLSIVRLNRSTGFDGYGLYRDSLEQTQDAILAGYGMSGTPATVTTGGAPAYPKGTRRVGWNKINSVGDVIGDGVQYIDYDLDHPSTTADYWGSLGADKEVMIGDGDSGGPTFLPSGGTLLLAGIHHVIYRADPNKWPQYGDRGVDVRISSYAPWIDSILPDQPATETGDFNMDNVLSLLDVNALTSRFNGTDLWYDLTGDNVVNRSDLENLVRTKIGTEFGDANLDHQVSLADYNVLASHFGVTGSWKWQDGDFNGDGKVSFADYQLLEAGFGFGGATGTLPGAPVPEPVTASLLVLGSLALVRRRR